MQKLCTIEWLKAASLGSRLTLNEGQKELTLSSLLPTTTTTSARVPLVRKLEKFFALSLLRLQSFSFCTSIQSNQPSLVLLLHAAAASSTAVKGEIQSASFPMWGCLCHTTRTKYEPIKVFGNVIIPASKWNFFGLFSFFIVVYQQNGSLQLSVVPTALNVKNNAKYSTQWFSRLERGQFFGV